MTKAEVELLRNEVSNLRAEMETIKKLIASRPYTGGKKPLLSNQQGFKDALQRLRTKHPERGSFTAAEVRAEMSA